MANPARCGDPPSALLGSLPFPCALVVWVFVGFPLGAWLLEYLPTGRLCPASGTGAGRLLAFDDAGKVRLAGLQLENLEVAVLRPVPGQAEGRWGGSLMMGQEFKLVVGAHHTPWYSGDYAANLC
jgi:hypothetical protein